MQVQINPAGLFGLFSRCVYVPLGAAAPACVRFYDDARASHRFQTIYEKLEQAIQSRGKEGRKKKKKKKHKNMKGSFLPDPQWIRKQRRSRGCSCVKTGGCITTMPLCSRLQPALNYVSAHSSPVILWTASLGGGVRTWGMAADCWQRAVASNLSVSIGSAAAAAAAAAEGRECVCVGGLCSFCVGGGNRTELHFSSCRQSLISY